MNQTIIEQAIEISQNYLDNSRSHGIPHRDEVHKHFLYLKNDPNTQKIISENLLDALEVAVILHDIGFKNGCRYEHAQRSADILKTEKNSFFDLLPSKNLIIYAIEHHPMRDEEKNDDENKCLALLTLLDHMDAIGYEGKTRAELFLKEVCICGQNHPNADFICDVVKEKIQDMKNNLEDYFLEPQKFEKKLKSFKDCHIFLHTLCNYAWIDFNYQRIENMLGKKLGNKFKEHYEKLKKDSEKIIRDLARGCPTT